MEIEEQIEIRSSVYKFFAMGFSYPTEDQVNLLSGEQYWLSAAQIMGKISESLGVEIKAQSKELRDEATKHGVAGFECEYNRLFQVAKQNACPLTAGQYMSGESRQAVAVAQLSGLYRSFGLQLRALQEADHIYVLLEFMAWLCAKQLRALEHADEYSVSSCEYAQRLIVEDYLGWLPLLRDGIAMNAELKYYLWLVNTLVAFVAGERALLRYKLMPAS
jgi:TorA maturation chaperone TorD